MGDIKKIALITGGAKRIGAEITKTLHSEGFDVVIHYRESTQAALALAETLNGIRADSACTVQADLLSLKQIEQMMGEVIEQTGQLDLLINNASSFYPTTLGETTEGQWDDLVGSNFKAPFFVSQAAFPYLKEAQGCIVNMVDIYAESALSNYPVYRSAKAALYALTESLAVEMAPDVRVNGVSPGVILWPEQLPVEAQSEMLKKIPLQKKGSPSDIAQTVLFLSTRAPYITGQVIAVDGGKGLV
ncbi:MAG: pteridine reductase [Cycloclasticus sp.]|nr:pteridine reductase [Cycloclasticus sp.]MBQ0790423.1 pteridine reductase [Cycloclasticus sp.]